ncbi:MAG: sulfatase-like hydrolase/transferase [Phycisphaerae bacterium]
MSNHPNVLVVFTDQQRWDTCGCYGNEMDLTPNLDALASRGTRMVRAFTCQPVCGPARASLQTGLFATAAGVHVNGVALPTDIPTLAKAFRSAGYDTGYIGKWHLSHTREGPVPRELRGGYDHWLGVDTLEHSSHPYEGTLWDADEQPVRFDGQYRVDFLTDRAIDFIDAERDNPFFLFLSFLEPHQQNDWNRFVAPEGYAERYRDCYVPPDLRNADGDWREQLADYYGMVARIDECLGRLLKTLQDKGLSDDTVVLFTSDHGCHFRTRNDEYKRSCHEASIHVPMVFAGPGFEGGGPREEMVSLVDVPPTLLAAAGVEPPAPMHGRNMTPLAQGQADGWKNEVFFQISESHVGRGIRTERWKYCMIAPEAERHAPSAERYRDHHLYDLQNDPHEQTNLVGCEGYAEIAENLRGRLAERMISAGEVKPIIDSAWA